MRGGSAMGYGGAEDEAVGKLLRASQEQQAFETFIDQGVQSFHDCQVLQQTIDGGYFAEFG
jgi:hypothetical protein